MNWKARSVLFITLCLIFLFLMSGCGESNEEKSKRLGRELKSLEEMRDNLERSRRVMEGRGNLEDYKQIEREKMADEIAKAIKNREKE